MDFWPCISWAEARPDKALSARVASASVFRQGIFIFGLFRVGVRRQVVPQAVVSINIQPEERVFFSRAPNDVYRSYP
jgi:hypothetical protein